MTRRRWGDSRQAVSVSLAWTTSVAACTASGPATLDARCFDLRCFRLARTLPSRGRRWASSAAVSGAAADAAGAAGARGAGDDEAGAAGCLCTFVMSGVPWWWWWWWAASAFPLELSRRPPWRRSRACRFAVAGVSAWSMSLSVGAACAEIWTLTPDWRGAAASDASFFFRNGFQPILDDVSGR